MTGDSHLSSSVTIWELVKSIRRRSETRAWAELIMLIIFDDWKPVTYIV